MAKKVVGKIGLAVAGRKGDPGTAGRSRARSVLAEHHGVLQGVQRPHEAQAGMIIPVEITVFEDRTFTFITKTPPASFLIKQRARRRVRLRRSQPQEGRNADATQVREIAQTKMPDLNANDIEHAMRIIAGTARSMGVEVEPK